MQTYSLSELFGHPSFISVLLTMLIVIGNIMVGVSMLPKDVRKKRYKLHRLVYLVMIISFGAFLIINHQYRENSWFNYFVLGYFLLVVPLTRRIHVTLHAILASIGLVLLGIVATLII